MSLDPGTRLGPYQITVLIGAGGMSACGHAARERGVGVRSRGGGPPPLGKAELRRAAPEHRGGEAPRCGNKVHRRAHCGARQWD